jgi:pyruvate formate lyase activating enzyme
MKDLSKIIFILFFAFGLIIACCHSPDINAQSSPREALYYKKLDNKKVNCQLCPRFCVIPSGKRGYCRVRENRDGSLYTLSYAQPVAIHTDPIEKKPLFHFLPSSTAFSIATVGCNLNCKFCQNWEISQAKPEDAQPVQVEPAELIKKIKDSGSYIVAYTYTEPTIFYEYMLETAKLAKVQGIKNVMHSNGYINEQPLRQLCKYMDAVNIDLKGFSEEYYAKLCEGALTPVLKSLKILKEEGVHLEITNLVLPGYNDDMATITKMCLWIKENLGQDTPLHFSRFTPMYKLIALTPTPVDTLEKARKIARDCGLKYVYIGNVPGHEGENTYCPRCKKIVIKRAGYFVEEINLDNGKCKFCAEKIEGIWK